MKIKHSLRKKTMNVSRKWDKPESPFSARVPANYIAPEVECNITAAFVSKKPALRW
jgi:hypothetical protein